MQKKKLRLIHITVQKLIRKPIFDVLNPLDPEKTESMAQSIEQNTYHDDEPITVWKCKEGYLVIDGFRRLAGIEKLGWEQAPCVVMEFADEAAALAHAKRRQGTRRSSDKYVILHRLVHTPLHQHGGDRVSKTTAVTLQSKPVALAQIADDLGVSERTVQRVKEKYFDNLTPEQVQEITGDKTAVYRVIAIIDQCCEAETQSSSPAVSQPQPESSSQTEPHTSDPTPPTVETHDPTRPSDPVRALFRQLRLIVEEEQDVLAMAKSQQETPNAICSELIRLALRIIKSQKSTTQSPYTLQAEIAPAPSSSTLISPGEKDVPINGDMQNEGNPTPKTTM